MLATVLQGLVPGVSYRAEVAAATSAGVGARSAPVPIHIGESLTVTTGTHGWDMMASPTAVLGMAPWHLAGVSLFPVSLAAPLVEQDVGPAGGSSLTEHLAEVARQPAFIAGVGGACWVILAAFAAWLYSRRRRKKELSHFTGTGGATPGIPHPSPSPISHPPSLSLQHPLPTHPPVSP